jgi:hypothetical protein
LSAGPDLTHVASRARIAGGMLENDTANMAAWVTHAQSLKPGSLMGSLTQFTGEELLAPVAYLPLIEVFPMRLDTKSLVEARTLEVLALTMIGDGVLALLQPERHMLLWRRGPRPWREVNRYFLDRPMLTRLVGAATVAAGLWLANRQNER